MPRWFPKGIVSRAESWVIEESEVDPHGKVVRCRTKNLDHVKVMQVEEAVEFRQTPEGFDSFYHGTTLYSFCIGKLFNIPRPASFQASDGVSRRE